MSNKNSAVPSLVNSFPVPAISTVEIEFKADELNIRIPVGTNLLVDVSENVALFGDNHFDIAPNEYSILFI